MTSKIPHLGVDNAGIEIKKVETLTKQSLSSIQSRNPAPKVMVLGSCNNH